MTAVRATFLEAAEFAARLLANPAVAARWDDPSALADMNVGALAGHLARQVLLVQRMLATSAGPREPAGAREPAGPREPAGAREPAGTAAALEPISLPEHYARAAWVDADLQDEANVSIRRDSEREAADGPAGLAARTARAAAVLAAQLPAEPADRAVFLPWGPWALTLDDMLRTRIMEIAVHGDDLTCSVDLNEPELPAAVAAEAIELLTRLSVRRHGAAALLRALSRAERAPSSIGAF
jgi:Mycothiol maleylpyruvate isomerase N-terminal domain